MGKIFYAIKHMIYMYFIYKKNDQIQEKEISFDPACLKLALEKTPSDFRVPNVRLQKRVVLRDGDQCESWGPASYYSVISK